MQQHREQPCTQPGRSACTSRHRSPAPAKDPTAGGNEPQDPDAQPQDTSQKKGGFQKRIDELTRERYEAERGPNTGAAGTASGASRAVRAAATGKARAEDRGLPGHQRVFPGTRCVGGRARGGPVRQEQAQETPAASEPRNSTRRRDRRCCSRPSDLQGPEAEVAEKYPDYHEAVQTPRHAAAEGSAARHRTRTVIDSPHGPEVVYFLGKNPQAAIALAQMTPFAAAREIGRIEQMFMQPKGQSTSAPPPREPSAATPWPNEALKRWATRNTGSGAKSQRKRKRESTGRLERLFRACAQAERF
jgi:hypothetical protein